ncbi:MAG: NAD-glutamate dehydrogenase [Hyphomicrobiales bacterium]|nr:NAD-glutamate dehydrogenase [Hyphomicrobiales bacterium]
MQHSAGSDEERSAALLVAAAEALLTAQNPTVPSEFISGLFGRAAPEDLIRYDGRELAALTQSAWAYLAQRAPGTPKIRITSPPGDSELLRHRSVIEIVNDDMPFLLDSVMGELAERGVEVRLVAHPVFTVTRDRDGRLTGFGRHRAAGEGVLRESFIHLHLERITDPAQEVALIAALEGVLADVRLSVRDWRTMVARVEGITTELKGNPPPLSKDEVEEAVAFLEWLVDDNFTFLGARSYEFSEKGDALEPVHETGLGLLSVPERRVLRTGTQLVLVTPEIRAFLMEPKLLIVTKSAVRSRVHRRVHMDYIGVKRFDAQGRLRGEFRIVGLFTSTAYTRSTRSIPYLRRKVEAVIARAGFDPNSHSGKALANVLDTYARDELFQIDEDTLYQFAMAILQLDERPRVRVLSRHDRFDRFVSILVYVPRDRYNSSVRVTIGAYLAEAYQGRVSAYYPFFPEGTLVRVHYIIGRDAGECPRPERAVLERAVASIIRTWADGLADVLAAVHEPGRARELLLRYRNAFSETYRASFSPQVAVDDIKVIGGLSASRPLSADFYRRGESSDGPVGLKVWSHGRPIPLSERVPVLENMGFKVVDEQTHHIRLDADSRPDVWLHDMVLECPPGIGVDLAAAKARLEACFLVVMTGGAENDGYNALALTAGLAWRDIVLIRTISRFLRQIKVSYSQDYMWETLVRHAPLAAQIVRLFHVRFDPREGASEARAERQQEIVAAIEQALTAVHSLDEDRILRHFVNAVQGALRTNYYQVDGEGRPKAQIAIKFASRKIEGLPLPRPLYEIFVYSPRVEGVHLRFGKVARGGIRWSDRPQDFRTEILGLVKAQQVKNAVIVPVGAKGGFVPKQVPKGGTREQVQAEGTAAYKLFIATLLDVTDNLGDDGVVAPDNVVRHDDDDPYLVVAADKGTATFSDIANAIAQERGFWLGDAFASGGSAGYDHKKMGITARGAWESVKRHFREMDINVGATPFTVAGVGDMSGDVFGNGLLREMTIRLIAAFDHRDIFIDPDPDPARSYAERKRLFELPRSSWQDYDKSLISSGGAVYPRSLKEIVLSQQAQQALGFAKSRATPQEVMNAILKAPADLLFFGGIGTYVRASTETDDAVGDRANDGIRVTGAELRCKVVGEGANLGMTQRGRVEAALRGVRLNTDAIDNAAGVNTSDLEVNIKIALARPQHDGRLTAADRNALLADMTDDVAALVLRSNYLQPLSISLAERQGVGHLGFQQRLMQSLESRQLLDRTVEFLPDDKELDERRRRLVGLTRPELSVLLAYAKLALKDELLESEVPDDPYLARELARYFPAPLAERFPDTLAHHRLSREIIATQLANSMINRGGPQFVVLIEDQTGAAPASIATAFAAVRESFGLTALNGEIDALDNVTAGSLQLELYAIVQSLLRDRVTWFLRNVELTHGLASLVGHYRAGIEAVESTLHEALGPEALAIRDGRAAEFAAAGVPAALARRLASLHWLAAAPDIVLVAERTGEAIADVAATYFAAQTFFQLDRIAGAARQIKVSDYFDRLALDRALDSIGDAERRLAAAMTAGGAAGKVAVEAWVATRADVHRIRAAVHEIANSGLTLSKLSVAASLLGDLVRS